MVFSLFQDKKSPQETGQPTSGSQKVWRNFELSGISVKSEAALRDRLLLLSAFKIASSILDDPAIKSADYKLNFMPTPKEGGKAAFIHTFLYPKDTVGLRVFSGQHEGQPIKVIFFRRKGTMSEVQKRTEKFGSSPYISAEPRRVTFDEVISILRGMTDEKSALSSSKKEHLAMVLGAAISEKEGRSTLLMKACGGDKAKYEKMQAIFKDIGGIINQIIKTDQERKEGAMEIKGDLKVSTVVGAADGWPLTESEAKSICHGLSKCTDEFLLQWSKKYALETLPSAIGVGILEYTTKDAIQAMQNVLRIAHEKSDKKEALEGKMESFDKAFSKLIGLVDEIDAEMKKMKEWITTDQEQWLSAICRLSHRRNKVLGHLRELEKLAEVFHHEDHYKKQLHMVLANISVNLCRINKAESDGWRELLSSEQVKRLFQGSKEWKGAQKKIKKFIAESEKEQELVKALESSVSLERSAYKQKVDSLSALLLEKIKKIGEYSPLVSQRLMNAYTASRRHVAYKQRERLSPHVEDAYLPRIRLLLALNEATPQPIRDSLLKKYVRQNVELFNTFAEQSQLNREIIMDIVSLLHVQKKGFDLESQSKKLHNTSFDDKLIDVQYSITVANVGTAESPRYADVLNLEFMNRQLQVPLKTLLPYEQGFAAAEVEPVSQKSIEEELYGKRLPLSEVVKDLNSGDKLGAIYEKLIATATSNDELYARVREKIESSGMDTAHFLSTLTDREASSGCVTNRLGRNMPVVLTKEDSKDMLRQLKAEYPDFEKDSSEVAEYIRITLAKRAVRWLQSSIPHYMMRYAEIVASAPEPTQA